MNKIIIAFDKKIIHFIQKYATPLGRLALFVVFFWFGFIKLFGVSPANELVNMLLAQTLPFITFESFIIFLGLFEMIIGLSFLIPKFERAAIFMMLIHMLTTFLPLVVLPEIAWQSFLVPTLEGQYIIKNIIIVVLAIGVAAHLKPMKRHGKHWNLA